MTMTGFWQHGVGIRTVDVGALLATNMTSSHPEMPYHLFAGSLAHFANGVLLALLWVAFVRRYVPGSWLLHGIAYGVLLTVVAELPRRVHADEAGCHALLELLDLESKLFHAVTSSRLLCVRMAAAPSSSIGFIRVLEFSAISPRRCDTGPRRLLPMKDHASPRE